MDNSLIIDDIKPVADPAQKPSHPKQQTVRKKKRKKKKRKPLTWRDHLRRAAWWTLGILIAIILISSVAFFHLWRRGWLPSPEELPRYKERLIIMLEGYHKAQLPEGEVIGIDISHYQGEIDWDELSFYVDAQRRLYRSSGKKRRARNVDFVIAKATQGINIRDSYYNKYKAGVRDRNILFGAYHFYSYQSAATQQAQNFIHTAGLQHGDLVPVLDVEPYKNHLPERDSVYKWLQIVERYYGAKPIVYTGERCYTEYFLSDKRFNAYPFWIARYGGKEPSRHHIIWQCAENGKVAGISGPVDLDIFRGTMHDIQSRYTIGSAK